jgi:NAD+ synthase (glutamine-hydrolysing)
MKIAIAQQNYILGHFDFNIEKIIFDIKKAIHDQADLIVFSELSISGYPPTDFLEIKDFVDKGLEKLNELLPYSKEVAILVGIPTVNPVIEGKDLYNSAVFLYEGEIKKIINKTLLPTYDIFDEYRFFEPNKNFECIEFKGEKIAVTICEDIWNIDNANPMYSICPMDFLIKENPTLMINLSASPFSYQHADIRKEIVKENCLKYNLPMIYCNSVGAQTEIIFDGGSMACDAQGHSICSLKYFEEDYAVVDLNQSNQPLSHSENWGRYERKHKALVLGIRDFFQKSGFQKAILGLSGGIDSALTLAIAVEALGSKNVLSVLMPSEYSSSHSVDDALQICKNLGSPYEIVPIKESYQTMLEALAPVFDGAPFNVAEENIQARIRGMILMAISNKKGHILLNTSNKSEMAVGYGTLYGDMCGALSVLGDLYKTEVYEMSRYINREKEIIPVNTIEKAPSAELRPNQKDQDSLPPYEVLDAILFEYIEKQQSPANIIDKGYESDLVYRILSMVNKNEFKRFQAPPILRVSSKAFGFGRRMPLVGKYL